MAQWVAAFVGDSARENYEITRSSAEFWVTSNRTPIRKAYPGDRVLMYLSGQGFVGEAVVASEVRAFCAEVRWMGNAPLLGLSLREVKIFSDPVPYKFPGKGPHPTLGFHRYALTGGFTVLSADGLEDVIARSRGPKTAVIDAPKQSNPPVPETPEPRVAESSPVYEPHPAPTAVYGGERRDFQKRAAGQHAKGEGRKRAVLWTLAEVGAQAVGWKKVERHAQEKVREAERTWISGGTAEEKVGATLEGLREHGFYIFHDVQLPEVGNVDHAALGPHGFFSIETKSHKGSVHSRGAQLLLNERSPEKDFISQTWTGCYRLREILSAEVTPILCFTEAFVEGRVFVKGVRVLPLDWMREELLRGEANHDSRTVAMAVNALGAATGCYPSSVPQAKS